MWSCIHSIPIPTDIRSPQGKTFVVLARNDVIPKGKNGEKVNLSLCDF